MIRAPTHPRTSFVGRGAELDELVRHCAGGVRVISIVGPPGVGKTRLASELLETAEGFGEHFFVDASSAVTESDLCEAMVAIFGGGEPTEDMLAQVANSLASGEDRLVVIDNVEQVIAAVRPAIQAWADQCPDVTFVLTSREPLGLPIETCLELAPLSLEADGGALGEATALFIDRAGLSIDGGVMDPTELASVERICRRLDGLPLAIELAAARARIMSPTQIDERLVSSWSLLTDRTGERPKRHHTLLSALEWSWQLLDPTEQQVVLQSTVFHGGFELDAAESVIDSGSMLLADVLENLVAKCLLKTRRGISGRTRFYALSVVRELAVSKLADGDSVRERNQHADYFLGWAREMLGRRSEPELGARIADDLPNLAAAHQWNLERIKLEGSDAHIESGLNLAHLFFHRAPLESAKRVTHDLLGATSSPGRNHARVLAVYGSTLLKSGMHSEAVVALESAAKLLEAFEPPLLADALRRLGWAVMASGRYQASRECFERALEVLSGAVAAPELEGQVLTGLGICLNQLGESMRASELLERATGLLTAAGIPDASANALMCSGWSLVELGRLEAGEHRLAAAAAIFQRIGADGDAGNTRRLLGESCFERGDLLAASQHFTEAVRLLEAGGRGWLGLHVEAFRGLVFQSEGHWESARECFDAALTVGVGPSGDYRLEPVVLCFRAGLLCQQDRLSEAERDVETAAARMSGITATDRWELDTVVDLYRGLLDATRARIVRRTGDSEVADGLEAAARMRMERADEGVDIPSGTPDATLPQNQRSAFVRRAQRVLRTALGKSQRELVVGQGGFWMTLPSGTRVDLGRRAACRRILWALGQHRIAEPGEGLSLPQLFIVGWPGIQAQPKSADWRVYDAVKTLRKLGLGATLRSADGGYFLSPEIVVVLDD